MKTLKTFLLITILTPNLYASNKADLTFFERFYEGGAWKGIYDDKDATIMSLRFPSFEEDLSMMLTNIEKRDGLTIQTGRFIKRLTPNIDAALKIDNYILDLTSWTKSTAAFDLHGNLFGKPSGIGIHIPFDEKDEIKIGSRMTFGDLTTFLTISEEKNHMVGASYNFDNHTVEVAYSNQTAWFFMSTLIELGEGNKLIPEFRLRITPEDKIFGFSLLLCF